MSPSRMPVPSGERGIALVMSLMLLMALSLLSVALMLTLQVETKIAGNSVRQAQAMNVTEAGVAEALARIRTGDVPNNMNPRMVSQIFLAVPGSVPVLGPDSIAMPTGQAGGQWLDYSKAQKGRDVLTVKYKTDDLRTIIYRYDPALASPVNYTSGLPIFVINATGRKGANYRRVQTEVIQRPFITRVEAALAADQGIDFIGNSSVCGFNHRMDTIAYTDGVHGVGPCTPWGVGNFDLPGAWSSQNVTSGGAAQQAGSPLNNREWQWGLFYAGPWEAVGLTQGEFFSWVGAPFSSEPSPPVGIMYLDNNATTQDQSGAFAVHGGNGEGLLYVDGDLSINGNFTFRGVVYIEGDLNITGNCWILGALIVRGKARIKLANGDMTVLYSRDAVMQNLARYGGQFQTLSWVELP